MKVFIATNFTLIKYQGKMYFESSFYTILKRYVSVFGKATICTKVVEKSELIDNFRDATELIEDVVPICNLKESFSHDFRKRVKNKLAECDLLIARVPSIIAYEAVKCARELKKPYLAEVMACAWDAYWNHSIKGKILAPYAFLKMKNVVKYAEFALYVTGEFLQKRYPTTGKNVGVSNVKIEEIDDDVIEKRLEKIANTNKNNITLMTSGAIYVRHKGQEYVIKAIKYLKDAGINVTYKLAGGGSKERLYNIAKKYGVENYVEFLGYLSSDEVLKNLDETDIYVQPSLQEGLPRAVIEAMSRGCLCIGARTGGIPELLQKRFVLGRRSVKDIVNAIKNICENENWEEIAKENFENSKEYVDTKLDERRNGFYSMIQKELSAKQGRMV